VHLKYEGLNPTGSFKDRGMTVAISKAVERGAQAVICASTGNTSASAAAYAARAGIRAFVLIPEGKIALGKLAQAMFHGAQVLQIRGNFDDALRLVREVSERHPVVLVNSVNPDRIEGQKTGAFEICEQLDGAPTYQFMPVGNAGNITAYWRGYREYHGIGKIARLPRMIGWQAEGAAPIVLGHIVEKPETSRPPSGSAAAGEGDRRLQRQQGHRRRLRREILNGTRSWRNRRVFCSQPPRPWPGSSNGQTMIPRATGLSHPDGHSLKGPARRSSRSTAADGGRWHGAVMNAADLIGRPWTMDDGPWTVDRGPWTVDSVHGVWLSPALRLKSWKCINRLDR
jgi:hypothetical protein